MAVAGVEEAEDDAECEGSAPEGRVSCTCPWSWMIAMPIGRRDPTEHRAAGQHGERLGARPAGNASWWPSDPRGMIGRLAWALGLTTARSRPAPPATRRLKFERSADGQRGAGASPPVTRASRAADRVAAGRPANRRKEQRDAELQLPRPPGRVDLRKQPTTPAPEPTRICSCSLQAQPARPPRADP